ncbi:MAG: rod shape-determining protein MreC [Deltaproteobacteria bacterium RBG_13_52_11]|nr:MAG: rod shape-determining protein MreC [Deltaproteobacteria bacterium RBG_13_52_11]
MFDLRRRRGTLVIVSLVLCTVVLISLQISGRYKGDALHNLGLRLLSPGQRAFHWTVDSVRTVFQNYVFLVHLKEENYRLQEEVRRLKRENDDLKESAQALERLRRLLLLKERVPITMISAEVVAYSPSASFRTIVINKGERDGVKKGVPVVTWEGVVGRVMRISPSSSVVLLVIDRNSSVDCLVQRTRTRGIVEGEGGDRCYLRYVPRTEDIQVGDHIITSGLEGIFPKGLSMGEVVRVEKKEYGLFQEVEVTPSAHFSRLEEVMVILSPAGGGEG